MLSLYSSLLIYQLRRDQPIPVQRFIFYIRYGRALALILTHYATNAPQVVVVAVASHEMLIFDVAPQETQRMSTRLSEPLARKLLEIVALIVDELKPGRTPGKHEKSD